VGESFLINNAQLLAIQNGWKTFAPTHAPLTTTSLPPTDGEKLAGS